MVETGPDTVVLEEDKAELMFSEPSRKLTPAEEAAYKKYQAERDEQDRLEHERLQRIGRKADEYTAVLQAQLDEEKQKQEREKIARANAEYDACLQAREEADEREWTEQCNLLLVQRAAREMNSQLDYEHEQVQVEKECKAAELHERDRINQDCLDQWEEDQE